MSADKSSARVGGKRGDYFEKCLRMEINKVLGDCSTKENKEGGQEAQGEDMRVK